MRPACDSGRWPPCPPPVPRISACLCKTSRTFCGSSFANEPSARRTYLRPSVNERASSSCVTATPSLRSESPPAFARLREPFAGRASRTSRRPGARTCGPRSTSVRALLASRPPLRSDLNLRLPLQDFANLLRVELRERAVGQAHVLAALGQRACELFLRHGHPFAPI